MYDFFPEWVVIAANVAIYVLIAAMVGVLVMITVKLKSKNYIAAFMIASNSFVLIYACGNAFKVAAVGPEFARYYLADIGFAPAAAFVLFGLYEIATMRNSIRASSMDRANRFLKNNKYKMVVGLFTFLLSIGYEWISGFAVDQLGNKSSTAVGHFDWLDIAAYALGTALFIGFLYGANRMARIWKAYELRVQDELQREAPKQRANVSVRRRYKKPQKPRGVR